LGKLGHEVRDAATRYDAFALAKSQHFDLVLLFAGGKDSTGALLSTAELYDPASGTFSMTGSMQSPRAQHTATLLANGKVLLIGSSTSTPATEIYDPASGIFTSTASLTQARAHHTATLLPDGKVLVLGGTQIMGPVGGGAPPADVSLDSAEIYDPGNGTFHIAGKLLTARDSHCATLLPNGTVLVAGGYAHAFDRDAAPSIETSFAAELFNPVNFDSTPAASLVASRAEHVSTLLNNEQVLVTLTNNKSSVVTRSPSSSVSLLRNFTNEDSAA
jgi:hypothetical protein